MMAPVCVRANGAWPVDRHAGAALNPVASSHEADARRSAHMPELRREKMTRVYTHSGYGRLPRLESSSKGPAPHGNCRRLQLISKRPLHVRRDVLARPVPIVAVAPVAALADDPALVALAELRHHHRQLQPTSGSQADPHRTAHAGVWPFGICNDMTRMFSNFTFGTVSL